MSDHASEDLEVGDVSVSGGGVRTHRQEVLRVPRERAAVAHLADVDFRG